MAGVRALQTNHVRIAFLSLARAMRALNCDSASPSFFLELFYQRCIGKPRLVSTIFDNRKQRPFGHPIPKQFYLGSTHACMQCTPLGTLEQDIHADLHHPWR